MDKCLSPSDAAERLGITPDTLRRWEREGKLQSDRTPGGQRRYREADIQGLLDGSHTQRFAPIAATRTLPTSPPRRVGFEDEYEPSDLPITTKPERIPEWERRVNEERADLEVTKIRREREALLRADREAAEERSRAIENERLAVAQRERDARDNEARCKRESERLNSLRAFGRAMCILAPADYQAKVTRDLQTYVNSTQFPADLNSALGYQYVQARVNEILEPWRDAESREREKRERVNSKTHKILLAMSRAKSRTIDWDEPDAREALAEIKEALDEELSGEPSDPDPDVIADEILNEWDAE